MSALALCAGRPSSALGSWLMRKALYPLWAGRRQADSLRFARQIQRTQRFSSQDLEKWQRRRLRELLLHAFRHVPFYRRRFEIAGITPLDINSVDELSAFPALTRAEVRKYGAELLARNIPVSARTLSFAGGSTGGSIPVWIDNSRHGLNHALIDRCNSWAGMRPRDTYASLCGQGSDVQPGSSASWLRRFADHKLLLNTALFSEDDLNRYVALLRQERPLFMVAHAQSAVLFARWCRRHAIRDLRFRSIIVTSEELLPGDRETLENVFGARVFNRYGCREFSIIAADCPSFAGMHVNADTLIVEVEPISGLPPGTGRVLVTDLFNRSMPLIRYEIGDLASVLETDPCPCGRSLPRIANVHGRMTDFLVTPDNRRISGMSLAQLTGGMPQVCQMQFVQKDAMNVQLRVVAGEGYGADTIAELRRRLDPWFRGTPELSIVTVDRIPTEPSGKYRYVINSSDLHDCFTQPRSA